MINMTKNFAHRGFSGKYPENTLLAFSKAIEEGVDGIENDVHLTKDGVLVVMHDELVDRTTNGKGYIKDKTYEELAQLDASYIFKEYGPQKVPTLREYLELVKDTDIITNIELKTGVFEYTGIEQKVYDGYQMRYAGGILADQCGSLRGFNRCGMLPSVLQEHDAGECG